MSRFAIAFESDNVAPTGEVAGAIFDIEKDIEKDRAIAGADIGDISEDETQSRIEEVLSIEALEEEITDELTDSGRVEEVADNLMDLSTIVERIEQPTETDIALIQTAANMAVAGTDVDAQDVLPALEAFTDMKVAAEGIGEKANAALASLRESAAALSEKVGEYIRKIFGALSYREKRLAELKAKVNALPNAAEGTFTVRGNTWLITDNKAGITDTKTLLAAGKDAVGMYSQYSDAYINLANGFKGSILKYYTTGVGEKSDAERDKLAKLWFDDFLGKMSKLKGMEANNRTSKPGFTTYASPAYLGADRIVVTMPTAQVTATTPTAELRSMITGSSFDVKSTIGFFADVAKTVAPDRVALTLNKGDLKQLVQLGETQISNMKKFLDKNYKAANAWNTVGGGSGGQAGSAYSRLIAKGRNTQFIMSMWTSRYGNGLLGTIEKLVAGGVHSAEKGSVTTEGFTGAVAGSMLSAVPGGASVSVSFMKNEIEHKKKQIDKVAKLIEKVKNGACDEAVKEGSISETTIAAARTVDYDAIITGAVLGAIPVISLFSGMSAGSQLQELSKELKTKIKELQSLAEQAKANANA